MTNTSTRLFILFSVFLGTLLFYPPQVAYGAGETQVECGDIVEGEFSQNAEEHIYLLSMKPKEGFEVVIEPAGDDLQTVLGIYGPTGVRINITNIVSTYAAVSKAPQLASGILSARGIYKIRVADTGVWVANSTTIDKDELYVDNRMYGGIGAYTLSIRCTKSDGSTIEPGESSATSGSSPVTTEQSSVPISPQQPVAQAPLTFLEIGQTYEVFFGSQTLTVKIVELRGDGWAQIEVKGRSGWLNINQVALIMPTNN